MSERFQQNLPDLRVPNFVERFQPLPGWLADRLLRLEEKVTWVRGPRYNPEWERYLTHPGLFFVTAAFGAICVGFGWVLGGWSEPVVLMAVAAALLVVGSIIVLGLTNGYFTRLVVTNYRLVILQGYEICRSWNLDDLPPSLIRYTCREGDKQKSCIDVDAVKSMLGGASDHFTNAKTILSFGKQLDRIQTRDRDRR